MAIPFFKDFKEFAIRGNVIDLSVGVIIGASFNKIVDVFVHGILMPPIGFLTGGLNFADKKILLKPAVLDATGKIIEPENAFRYGELIQATVVFLITAFAVFLLIRLVNAIRRKHADAAKEEHAAPLTTEEKLLTEIRDLLKR